MTGLIRHIIKLSGCFGIIILITFAIFVADGIAAVIPDRTTLNTLLSGGGTTDDFESYNVADGSSSVDTSVGSLGSTTLVNGQGPGLVHSGATYVFTGSFIQWNGNNYFGLNTKTILCGPSQILEIDYTSPVIAMGIDLEAFSGFPDSVTAKVYGPGGLIFTSSPISVNGPSPVFFGYQDPGGIVKVIFTGSAYSFSVIIDNHTYGGSPPASVPTMTEWGMIMFMVLAGLGAIYYLRRERRA